MRVFLIAESVRRREMLEARLSTRGVQIAGTASGVENADEELLDGEADVLLVDGAGESAEEILEQLREKELLADMPVMLLTEQSSGPWSTQAVRAGLRGILPANVGPDLLVAGLAAASQGLVVLHPEQVNAVGTSVSGSLRTEMEEASETMEALTSREKEVLRMLAGGLGNKQIAAELRISEHTVKFHVASVFGKLGVSTRAEAVAIGMRRGLILL
jgi:two-component system, NarL family, response regulator YdfI